MLKNPIKLHKLQEFFFETPVDYNVIYNMMYFKLLRSFKNLFPQKPKESVADKWLRQGNGVLSNGIFRNVPIEDLHPTEIDSETEAERQCARTMLGPYRYAVDRIYLDENFPTKELKKDFIHKVLVILEKVKNGLRVS